MRRINAQQSESQISAVRHFCINAVSPVKPVIYVCKMKQIKIEIYHFITESVSSAPSSAVTGTFRSSYGKLRAADTWTFRWMGAFAVMLLHKLKKSSGQPRYRFSDLTDAIGKHISSSCQLLLLQKQFHLPDQRIMI